MVATLFNPIVTHCTRRSLKFPTSRRHNYLYHCYWSYNPKKTQNSLVKKSLIRNFYSCTKRALYVDNMGLTNDQQESSWTTTKVRQTFLDFFCKENGHTFGKKRYAFKVAHRANHLSLQFLPRLWYLGMVRRIPYHPDKPY